MRILSYQWDNIGRIKVIYRICDKKPNTQTGIPKIECLKNFDRNFGLDEDSIVIADNCSDTILKEINELNVKVIETNLGNAGTLKKAFEIALELDDDDRVYFVEDDFLHLPEARNYLLEGLARVHYVSLYDHADKYSRGPNPYVTEYGEQTRVFLTKSSHWKFTNSTVQTFATRVKTLKEDKNILFQYNFGGPVPDSFRTFMALKIKGRLLATPIPGRATHCHFPWESPLIDWKV